MKDEHVCEFCIYHGQPIRLKRQWVHYFPLRGQTFICQAKNLKPALFNTGHGDDIFERDYESNSTL